MAKVLGQRLSLDVYSMYRVGACDTCKLKIKKETLRAPTKVVT